jgi:hypothetical protein
MRLRYRAICESCEENGGELCSHFVWRRLSEA